ncbi:hypothetical protein OKW49_001723 [Paraburkholderia youngii]|uniref:hypothetical protein n=1 Tax=Paraburkholderia youngii TaxID=2782701 RepID=UPI003D1D9F58
MSSSNPGPTAEDKLAFCVACTALDQATRDLQQLRSNPATSLNALSKAQRDYELSRVQWQRCQWQLRAATAHAVKRPSQCIGAVVIVGHDKAVRDSLRVLLNVKGYGRSKALGFDHWHEIWLEPSRQLIILDVPVNSITTALWFVESFDTSGQFRWQGRCRRCQAHRARRIALRNRLDPVADEGSSASWVTVSVGTAQGSFIPSRSPYLRIFTEAALRICLPKPRNAGTNTPGPQFAKCGGEVTYI